MRICFVVHQGVKEGASLFMLDQVDYLLSKGLTIFVILPRTGNLDEALKQRGVETVLIPNPWWIKPRWTGSGDDHAKTLASARAIAVLLREWKIDVVYTETVVAPGGALAAALAGLPHVWHIHEFAYNARGIEMAIPKRELARLIESTSNAVFFNSKAVASDWEGWLAPEKTRVVYNWTPAITEVSGAQATQRDMSERTGTFEVTVVGSILRLKRQLDAIRAVDSLVREGLDVRLTVVGPVVDDTYQSELEEFVRAGLLGERISFAGYTEKPRQFMREADVAVLCSETESFGRVTVEAMAEGTPVIGSNVGGTAEIIQHEVNGLLFPVGDVAALASGLRRLMQDTAFRQRLSAGALQRARDFENPHAIMQPVIALLEGLVGEKNPASPVSDLIGTGLLAMDIPSPTPPVERRPRRISVDRVKRAIRRLW